MKAITVRNPWAYFIMIDEKTIEVRTWKTDYRGDLLICSSASPKIEGMISGYALCVAELTDIVPLEKKHLRRAMLEEMPEKESYAWKLKNIRIIYPFETKGKLKLFDIEDELIKIPEQDGEGASEFVEKYIMPLTYKK